MPLTGPQRVPWSRRWRPLRRRAPTWPSRSSQRRLPPPRSAGWSQRSRCRLRSAGRFQLLRVQQASPQLQQPVVPVMLRAAPVHADRSKEALHTPRSKPMPPGTEPFEWKPARINADSAAAGPNGIVDACGLQRGKFTVVICTE